MTFGDLPAINACLNGASALFLGAGYVLIRQGRWRAHRGFMLPSSAAASITRSNVFTSKLLTFSLASDISHRAPNASAKPRLPPFCAPPSLSSWRRKANTVSGSMSPPAEKVISRQFT
jgi:hypothetical protein